MIPTLALAALAALSPAVNVPDDDPDDGDMAAVIMTISDPEWTLLCGDMPSMLELILESPSVDVVTGTDMLVAWAVEEWEAGYGENLSEEAEYMFEEELYRCATGGLGSLDLGDRTGRI